MRLRNKLEKVRGNKVSFVDGLDDFYDPIKGKNVDIVTISHHLFKDARFDYIEKKLILPLDFKNIPNFAME